MMREEIIADVGTAAEAVSTDEEAATPLHQIESLCMRCGENGTTRLLLTRIPHFREVVLMAFECPHCNERNNEVQFAGQLQPQGCCYILKVPENDSKILNRQVVKSDSASIKVGIYYNVIYIMAGRSGLRFFGDIKIETDTESVLMFSNDQIQSTELTEISRLPYSKKKFQNWTLRYLQKHSVVSFQLLQVEGVLLRAADELHALQEERRKVDPKTAEALDHFLLNLNLCATGKKSFTFVLDDPAGNSFIENPFAPMPDPLLSVKFYTRTPDQQAALGFLVESTADELVITQQTTDQTSSSSRERARYIPAGTTRQPHGSVGASAAHRAIAQGNSEEVAAALFKYSTPEEVMTFPSTCGACGARCETRMYVTNIPYFKEVIIMASTCDICGYRNSELKPGGSIPEKGKKITAHILNKDDLSRDVIKSDTAKVIVPELDLELAPGTLGGLVTTVEGLMTGISENLKRVHGFSVGDSVDEWKRSKWQDFDSRLRKLLEAEAAWTLILDDALANSFIAPATETIEEDTQLKIEEYERSWEQNEELGLNDMDTASADVAYI